MNSTSRRQFLTLLGAAGLGMARGSARRRASPSST
ncbi:MAG: twin-arginine translocation signal domain-containing protein [Edaphobacter sp.]